jgi:hypothetical protein
MIDFQEPVLYRFFDDFRTTTAGVLEFCPSCDSIDERSVGDSANIPLRRRNFLDEDVGIACNTASDILENTGLKTALSKREAVVLILPSPGTSTISMRPVRND